MGQPFLWLPDVRMAAFLEKVNDVDDIRRIRIFRQQRFVNSYLWQRDFLLLGRSDGRPAIIFTVVVSLGKRGTAIDHAFGGDIAARPEIVKGVKP